MTAMPSARQRGLLRRELDDVRFARVLTTPVERSELEAAIASAPTRDRRGCVRSGRRARRRLVARDLDLGVALVDGFLASQAGPALPT